MKKMNSDRYSDNDDVAWPSEEEDKESSYAPYLDREQSYDYSYSSKKVSIMKTNICRITSQYTQLIAFTKESWKKLLK